MANALTQRTQYRNHDFPPTASDALLDKKTSSYIDPAIPLATAIAFTPACKGAFNFKETRLDYLIATTVGSGALDRNNCRANTAPNSFEFHWYGYRHGGAANETAVYFRYDPVKKSGSYEEDPPLSPATIINFDDCEVVIP
jgi:hypothetical protein